MFFIAVICPHIWKRRYCLYEVTLSDMRYSLQPYHKQVIDCYIPVLACTYGFYEV